MAYYPPEWKDMYDSVPFHNSTYGTPSVGGSQRGINIPRLSAPLSSVATAGIGAAGGIIGSAIGGLIGNYQQKKANEYNQKMLAQQFEYNKQLAEQEYRMNLEQWNRENEYNSPAAQLARMTQAGINPHIAYSKGSINNVAARSPTYNAPSYGFAGAEIPDTSGYMSVGQNAMQNVVKSFIENKNLAAQGDYVRAQTQKTLLQAAGHATNNRIANALENEVIQQGRNKTAISSNEVDRVYWLTENLVASWNGRKLINQFNAETFDGRVAQVQQAIVMVAAQIALNELQQRFTEEQTDTERSKQANLKAQTDLTTEQWEQLKRTCGFKGTTADLKILRDLWLEGAIDDTTVSLIGAHIGVEDGSKLLNALGNFIPSPRKAIGVVKSLFPPRKRR